MTSKNILCITELYWLMYLLLARLEAVYSLIWGAHQMWRNVLAVI